MSQYKYLVMQSNPRNSVMFLTANLSGGGQCANVDTNVTHFKPHDFGGGHDNGDYWSSPEELLVGFCRWYTRTEELEAYNMGNRFFAATNTYRFFKVCDDNWDNGTMMSKANMDLKPYEITEEDFIKDMIDSYAFKTISKMFPDMYYGYERFTALPVIVKIVYNKEFNTWCWISDYLNKSDYKGLEVKEVHVPVGYHFAEAVGYISARANCEYRFGANDEYYKRKALEQENVK